MMNLSCVCSMYCVYGSDRIGYMFLGVVGMVLFLRRNWRVFGAGLVIVGDAALMRCRNLNPDVFAEYMQKEEPVAAFVVFVIASVSIMKLFNVADEKLYHAKNLGKHNVVFDGDNSTTKQ